MCPCALGPRSARYPTLGHLQKRDIATSRCLLPRRCNPTTAGADCAPAQDPKVPATKLLCQSFRSYCPTATRRHEHTNFCLSYVMSSRVSSVMRLIAPGDTCCLNDTFPYSIGKSGLNAHLATLCSRLSATLPNAQRKVRRNESKSLVHEWPVQPSTLLRS